jgi:hypothetical protein
LPRCAIAALTSPASSCPSMEVSMFRNWNGKVERKEGRETDRKDRARGPPRACIQGLTVAPPRGLLLLGGLSGQS